MRSFGLALAMAFALGSGCGPDRAGGSGGASGGASGGSGGSGGSGTGGAGGCVGLACQQMPCPGGQQTTVSGTVTTPKGDLPLYNVFVYVPNAPLDPIITGASCDRCDTPLSGNPLVQTRTDTHGRFVLANMPVGANVPLVIQIGKWRRLATIANVAACTDTPLGADATRLPRNQSEGNLPKIALATGGADALECLLRKIGIDDGEFTPPAGPGRINLFGGHDGTNRYAPGWNGGAMLGNAQNLWNAIATLAPYDLVVLSCEGTFDAGNKSAAALAGMKQYLEMGGRVFASHWHNYWVERGPAPMPTVATFNHQSDLANPFTASIDTSFPRGVEMADWLVNVGASTTPAQLVIRAGQHTIDAVNGAVSQRWIYGTNPTSVQYLSFNLPIGAPSMQECGRMVLTDIHVSSGDTSDTSHPFPSGCTTTSLSPQEKALVFMLFDLSACLMPGIG